MACAGFILEGAEKFLGGADKKSWGAETRPKGAKKFSAPLAEQTRGGAENLILPRERGRNI